MRCWCSRASWPPSAIRHRRPLRHRGAGEPAHRRERAEGVRGRERCWRARATLPTVRREAHTGRRDGALGRARHRGAGQGAPLRGDRPGSQSKRRIADKVFGRTIDYVLEHLPCEAIIKRRLPEEAAATAGVVVMGGAAGVRSTTLPATGSPGDLRRAAPAAGAERDGNVADQGGRSPAGSAAPDRGSAGATGRLRQRQRVRDGFRRRRDAGGQDAAAGRPGAPVDEVPEFEPAHTHPGAAWRRTEPVRRPDADAGRAVVPFARPAAWCQAIGRATRKVVPAGELVRANRCRRLLDGRSLRSPDRVRCRGRRRRCGPVETARTPRAAPPLGCRTSAHLKPRLGPRLDGESHGTAVRIENFTALSRQIGEDRSAGRWRRGAPGAGPATTSRRGPRLLAAREATSSAQLAGHDRNEVRVRALRPVSPASSRRDAEVSPRGSARRPVCTSARSTRRRSSSLRGFALGQLEVGLRVRRERRADLLVPRPPRAGAARVTVVSTRAAMPVEGLTERPGPRRLRRRGAGAQVAGRHRSLASVSASTGREMRRCDQPAREGREADGERGRCRIQATAASTRASRPDAGPSDS